MKKLFTFKTILILAIFIIAIILNVIKNPAPAKAQNSFNNFSPFIMSGDNNLRTVNNKWNTNLGTSTPSGAKLNIWSDGINPPLLVTDTSSSTLFTILADGNVGIGTSSPFAKLAVENTGIGHTLLISDEANDESAFLIDADGLVAIGTSTPYQTGLTLVVDGEISSPHGEESERFGKNSSATGKQSVAFGNNARANNLRSVAFGSGAIVADDANMGTALCWKSNFAEDDGIAIGFGASIPTGDDGIAIGNNSIAGFKAVAISSQAEALANLSFALGFNSTITSNAQKSIVFGDTGLITEADSFGFGADVLVHTANTAVFGSDTSAISNLFFGKGATSTSPTAYTINGTAGYGTNIAGGGINFSGGQGTGSGAGGAISFWTADGGASGDSQNTLAEVMRITDNGLVGIGTANLSATLPGDVLHVAGTKNSITIPSSGGIMISDLTSMAQGVGGAIIFRGNWTGTTETTAATIHAYKSNGSGSSFLFDLVFNTRAVGGNTEKMRITSNGNVGIATTTPVEKLDVNGNIAIRNVGLSKFYGSGGGQNSFNYMQGYDPSFGSMNFHVSGESSNILAMTLERGTGHMGIGEMTPEFGLELSASSSLGYLGLGSSDGDVFIIDGNGNVGIASSSPFVKFGLVGDAYIKGDLTVEGDILSDNDELDAYGIDTFAIANGAWDTVTFPSFNETAGDMTFDGIASTTIARTAKYEINLDLFGDKTAGGTAKIEVSLFVNNLQYTDSSGNNPCSAERDVTNDSVTGFFELHCIAHLNASDIVVIKARANSANARFNMSGGNITNPANRKLLIDFE